MLAGVGFRGGELAWLVVSHISPRETVADHFHVDEALAQKDAPHFPVIPVDVDDLDADVWLNTFPASASRALVPNG